MNGRTSVLKHKMYMVKTGEFNSLHEIGIELAAVLVQDHCDVLAVTLVQVSGCEGCEGICKVTWL